MADVDDSGFLSALMPNRARAKFMRFAAGFCIFIGLLAGFTAIRAILINTYRHSHWSTVKGDILSYAEKSAVQPESGSRHNVYWIEFQVEFDPRELGCTTGSSWAVPREFSCIGAISTPATKSWANTQTWVTRHRPNSAAAFLYGQAGGRLRFADESAVDVVQPESIIVLLVAGGMGLLLLFAAKKRLRFLDATPPYSQPDTDPNELTDLKLS